ncbi:MAG: hypothetical protein AB8C84_11510 [Oligoflexales bacterium]
MQLLSLRYQRYPQAEEKVFSVRSRGGKFAHVAALFTSAEQSVEIAAALSHLFGGNRPCHQVSMEWSDSTGSLWKMQRKNQFTTLLKNGDPCSDEPKFRPYQIDLLDPNPKALPLHMDQSLYNQAALLSKQACLSAQLPELSPLRVASLAEQLDRIKSRYQTLAFLHKKQTRKDAVADPLQLRKELHLIHQIEDQLDGLRNTSQMQLLEKITTIQNEIESILKDAHIQNVSHQNFEKTLTLLSQRVFLQRGLEATRNMIDRGEESLAMVSESTWNLTDQNLAQNFSLSEELQKEFDKTVHALTIQSENTLNWFDKFRKGQQKNQDFDREKVQELRENLNSTLAKLNQLREHLYENENDFRLPLQRMQKWYENQVQKKKSLDKQWDSIQQNNGLPQNISLSSLMSLASQFGRLAELHSEHKNLTAKLKWRQQKIENIRGLLVEWRQLTNNQDGTELNTPAVILSEAKSLLNLGHKKQKNHDTLLRSYGDYQAQTKLLQQLEYAGQNAQKEWEHCFNSLTLPPISIGSPLSSQFIRDGLLIRALTRNHEECLPFQTDSEDFALWHIVGQGKPDNILQQAKRADPQSLHLILSSQEKPNSDNVPDFCHVIAEEKTKSIPPTPPSQKQTRPTQNLHSPSKTSSRQNVQQVLDLLNGGPKSRKPSSNSTKLR